MIALTGRLLPTAHHPVNSLVRPVGACAALMALVCGLSLVGARPYVLAGLLDPAGRACGAGG